MAFIVADVVFRVSNRPSTALHISCSFCVRVFRNCKPCMPNQVRRLTLFKFNLLQQKHSAHPQTLTKQSERPHFPLSVPSTVSSQKEALVHHLLNKRNVTVPYTSKQNPIAKMYTRHMHGKNIPTKLRVKISPLSREVPIVDQSSSNTAVVPVNANRTLAKHKFHKFIW